MMGNGGPRVERMELRVWGSTDIFIDKVVVVTMGT
jgi:hypothetical protein